MFVMHICCRLIAYVYINGDIHVYFTCLQCACIFLLSDYRVLDSSSDMATTLIGTPYYMSPELFSNKPYNGKVLLLLLAAD